MNIGLSAVGFLPGKMGGMEMYFRNIVHYLQLTDRDNRYELLCNEGVVGEFPLESPRFKIRKYNYAKPSVKWFVRGVLMQTSRMDILAPVFDRLRVDIMHHPFTILNPMGLTIPSVLTLHDIQHEFFPDFFSSFELKNRRELIKKSVLEATMVIAISKHGKFSLIDKYDIAPEKVEVVYIGCGPEFGLIEDDDELVKARSQYGLGRPFLFYPAATWPHKNHKMLLAALKLLIDRYHFEGELVLSGIAMKAHHRVLEEIERLDLKRAVKVLGYVPREDLPYLYNDARLLVFPSLFEGFGIPLVEAMACGCPVVCSNTTSVPEVVGDCGVFFDPNSAEDMAEKIWKTWNDEEQLKSMRVRGLERAKMFNWEDTARRTIEVYRKTAERSVE